MGKLKSTEKQKDNSKKHKATCSSSSQILILGKGTQYCKHKVSQREQESPEIIDWQTDGSYKL
jgi:hypothetical protein